MWQEFHCQRFANLIAVSTPRIAPRHLDRLLPKSVGNRALVIAHFSQDHCYGVSKAVERQSRLNPASLLKAYPHLPPRGSSPLRVQGRPSELARKVMASWAGDACRISSSWAGTFQ
jgi:hypothetical protein